MQKITDDMSHVQYIAKDQEDFDLKWVDSQNGEDAPHSVHVTINGQKFLFGRAYHVQHVQHRKKPFLRVGKVGTEAPNKKMYYGFLGDTVEKLTDYKVLVCTPKANLSIDQAQTTSMTSPALTPVRTFEKELLVLEGKFSKLQTESNATDAELQRQISVNQKLQGVKEKFKEIIEMLMKLI